MAERAEAGPPDGPTDMSVGPVDLVAFVVEVAAFVLLAWWGWRIGGDSAVLRVSTAAALVVAAGVAWGLVASPRARHRSLPGSIATKVVVLGASVVAASILLRPLVAVIYALVVVVDTVLLYVGPWARDQ